jgi:SAM-dependent methyltransferase
MWALERTRSSAQAIVPLVMQRVAPRSVVDFGCGVGVWLETFASHGVDDYMGVDGPWVPRDVLLVSKERFVVGRLDKPLDLGRDFDLAVALEVAEHLPERRAGVFVRNVVEHAPCVLFSAAIPRQGGTDHVNEQWPDYWVERFAAHGYVVVDGIRPLVWSNTAVLPFYRQNAVLFATPDTLAAHPLLERDRERTAEAQLSIVHPDVLESISTEPGEHMRRASARDLMLGELVRALPAAVARSVRWRVTRPTSRRRQRDLHP